MNAPHRTETEQKRGKEKENFCRLFAKDLPLATCHLFIGITQALSSFTINVSIEFVHPNTFKQIWWCDENKKEMKKEKNCAASHILVNHSNYFHAMNTSKMIQDAPFNSSNIYFGFVHCNYLRPLLNALYIFFFRSFSNHSQCPSHMASKNRLVNVLIQMMDH